MTEPNTIDFTPPGLRTPAGVKRVNESMAALEGSTVAFANAASLLLTTYAADLAATASKELRADLAELRKLQLDRHKKQDAFLSAIAGR
jgi:hypothetical protein